MRATKQFFISVCFMLLISSCVVARECKTLRCRITCRLAIAKASLLGPPGGCLETNRWLCNSYWANYCQCENKNYFLPSGFCDPKCQSVPPNDRNVGKQCTDSGCSQTVSSVHHDQIEAVEHYQKIQFWDNHGEAVPLKNRHPRQLEFVESSCGKLEQPISVLPKRFNFTSATNEEEIEKSVNQMPEKLRRTELSPMEQGPSAFSPPEISVLLNSKEVNQSATSQQPRQTILSRIRKRFEQRGVD